MFLFYTVAPEIFLMYFLGGALSKFAEGTKKVPAQQPRDCGSACGHQQSADGVSAHGGPGPPLTEDIVDSAVCVQQVEEELQPHLRPQVGSGLFASELLLQ